MIFLIRQRIFRLYPGPGGGKPPGHWIMPWTWTRKIWKPGWKSAAWTTAGAFYSPKMTNKGNFPAFFLLFFVFVRKH
jgi:hypothetical protein